MMTGSRTLSRRVALAGIAGGGAWLAAGSGTAAAQTPRIGGVLKVVILVNPSNLDPATGRAGSDHVVLYPVFDTLVTWDPATLTARPGLASAWAYPDPQTLEMTLREGIKFHDGTPFDAQAAKANLDRALTNPRSNVKEELASVASVEAPSPTRLMLHLSRPDSALPLILSDRAGMMASPASLQRPQTTIDRNPVGSGPWIFVEWDDNNQIVVRRNPEYWQKGLPFLDGIEFKVVTDPNTGLRSVTAGQNDFVFRIPPQQVPTLKRNPAVVVNIAPSLYMDMIYLNNTVPPLQDVRVRQALNYAVNRVAFARVTTAGTGDVAGTYVPPSHWAYDAQAANTYPYDPDKARALLADAGFKDGFDINALMNADQLSFQRMEIISEQYKQVGIRLHTTSAAVAETSVLSHDPSKKIGVWLSSWTGRPDLSSTLSLLFAKSGYYNISGRDLVPELAQAIANTRGTADQQARKQAFGRPEQLERQWALSVPLCYSPEIAVFSPKVKGYVANLNGKPRFDAVWLES